MPTCAHDEHTQQHVTLVLCGGDVVGKLWTGQVQSCKALREDRVGLDDVRRKTRHRVPTNPPAIGTPALRESEKQRTFRRGIEVQTYFFG